MNIVYRSAKGSKLTSDEVDGNFAYLEALVGGEGSGYVSQTGYSLVAGVLTINVGWIWRILGGTFSNGFSEVVINIPLAAAGMQRIDRIVATTSNTFIRVAGTPSETTPLAPPKPDNSLDWSFVLVTDSAVGTPTDPIIGTQFVKKNEFAEILVTDSGDITIGLDTESTAFVLTGDVTSVIGFEMSSDFISNNNYVGKEIRFTNNTGADFPITHNGASTYPARFPSEVDFVLKNNETIFFKPVKRDVLFLQYCGVGRDVINYSDIVGAPTINEHFKGKYTSLVALQTAHPTANAGDYGQVDTGAGSDVLNYNWDSEEGWVIGSAGSGATDTDMLPEGSSNLYHTAARVLATALSGLSASSGTFTSSDSVLTAFNKVKYLIDNVVSIVLTDVNFGAFTNSLTGKATPVDADAININDSADSNKQKKVTWANAKATLKTYFDTLYAGGTLPFVYPESYGAVGDDTTDDTTALQNAINSGFPVYLSKKTYKITATLTTGSNQVIIGSGKASKIHLTTTNIAAIEVQGSYNTLSNFALSGSSSGSLQVGILADGGASQALVRIQNKIQGVYFDSFGGSAISIKNIVGSSGTTLHEGGFTISDCIISNCQFGINFGARGEYNTASNCKIYNCSSGYDITGGNNTIIGGLVTECGTGIWVKSGTNDAHGIATGVLINHNTNNVRTVQTNNPFTFVNCCIYAGGMILTNTVKTIFSGCQISMSAATLTITNAPIEFIGCEWVILPTTYTLTGVAPKMIENYIGALKLATPNVSYAETTTITANTTFTIPVGHYIESVIFENTTANAVTGGIKIGTTNGGTEVVVAKAVGANELVAVTDAELLKKVFSITAGTTLYIQAVTAWNSASVKTYFKIKPII